MLVDMVTLLAADGQTGSGKTFSMSGVEEKLSDTAYKGGDSDGIIPRSMQYIFNAMEAARTAGTTLI